MTSTAQHGKHLFFGWRKKTETRNINNEKQESEKQKEKKKNRKTERKSVRTKEGEQKQSIKKQITNETQ